MLVLSRQRGETVIIEGGIEVTIIDVRGEKVRLGITAPKDVAVHRKEVFEAIQRSKSENKDGGGGTPGTPPGGNGDGGKPQG